MIEKTQFKTDIVKRYKKGESSHKISKNEGCSYNAVLRELKRRGVNTGRRFWAKKEIEKLKKLYPVASNEELLKEFPDRTEKALKGIAKKLRLKKRKAKKICKGCGEKFTIKYRGKYNTKGFCLKCAKKEWEQNNRENAIERNRRWLLRNPDYLKQYATRPEVKKRIYAYLKQLRRENPKYRLDQNMSYLIRLSLKDKKAGRQWETLVGYTLNDLIEHLERQFDDKMNWDNYGSYWHVDHIKPRSLFRYTLPEDPEFKKCWALKNLQPLERIANIRKNCKYTSNIFETKPSSI